MRYKNAAIAARDVVTVGRNVPSANPERQVTRSEVLAAARRLFLAQGYAATKMTDIAKEAGVALASVYRAGSSKADLVGALIIDESTVDPGGRRETPQFPQVAAETDPVKRVEVIADLAADVLERVAPLVEVLRDAAAVNDSPARYCRPSGSIEQPRSASP